MVPEDSEPCAKWQTPGPELETIYITYSYVYWTVHHLDSWIKRDQLDVTRFIISLFTVQHVSDVNTSETCWAVNNEIIKRVTSSSSYLYSVTFSFYILFLYYVYLTSYSNSQAAMRTSKAMAIKHLVSDHSELETPVQISQHKLQNKKLSITSGTSRL